jgi:hypothetical protein
MSGIAIGRNAQVVRDRNCEDFSSMEKKLSLTYCLAMRPRKTEMTGYYGSPVEVSGPGVYDPGLRFQCDYNQTTSTSQCFSF